MQKEKELQNKVGKRLSSIFIVIIMVSTSFIAMIPKNAAVPLDVIKTYVQDGEDLLETSNFGDGDIIILNVTVDHTIGDPPVGPPYFVNVTNETGTWINVAVHDNKTGGPLDDYNTNQDSRYWGAFQVGTDPTNQGATPPYLHLNDGEEANISEIPSGSFDGDAYIAYHVITEYYSGPPPSYMFLEGQVKDHVTEDPILDASIYVYKEGQAEGFNNGPYDVHGAGFFSVNITIAGPGSYTIQVERDGYIGYRDWGIAVSDGETKNLSVVYLEPLFGEGDEAYIQGNVNATDPVQPIPGTEIMLLDTDFHHFLGKDGNSMTSNVTDEEGRYVLPISYRSTYVVIAYAEGYYADFSDSIVVTEPGELDWVDFSLLEAAPDSLNITFTFTDLDDVIVTVNRSVIAASRVFRFALDINPEIGDGNQIVSESETDAYLQVLDKNGPGFKSFGGGNGGDNENKNDPGLLEIPINILLDGSLLDSYVASSHVGWFDNLANTPITSDQTIYYNATFHITLDGMILNQTSHPLNITTVYNHIIAVNMTCNFTSLYNVTDISGTFPGYFTNTTTTLGIAPEQHESGDAVYANITLSLNGSTVTLPIIEPPTWNIDDRWTFSQTGASPDTLTYTVNGKPLREGDQDRYRIDQGDTSYLCYELLCGEEYVYVTMDDLDWINMSNKTIGYVVNDIDFPVYGGKSWVTKSWWNETVTAEIVDSTDEKVTGNGTFSCVKIEYWTETPALVGEEWYSPLHKFFVNRTRLVDGELATSLNLSNYSQAPYFDSLNVTAWEDPSDDDPLINTLNATAVINTSYFYDGPLDYTVQGPLYVENPSGPQYNIAWLWNDTGLQNLVRGSGNKSITLSYSGTLINASGIDGPYSIWFELQKQTQSNPPQPPQTIDYISAVTEPYSYLQFQSPAATIMFLDDKGNDTNANGLLDYLTVNVTLNVLETGYYMMNGGLNYQYGNEQQFITGTGTGSQYFEAGDTPTVQLNFDGTDIYEQGYDSPYRINIEVWDVDSHTIVIQNESDATGTYLHTGFERPSIYFDRDWMADTGLHDYINQSTYLTINISIFVVEGTFGGGTGTYDLHSGLENNTRSFMTGTGGPITLSEGNNIIPVNFNIGDIYQRNPTYTGTFTMHLGFSERIGDWIGPDIDNSMYETKEYDLNDPESFPPPPVTLELVSDAPSDDGNNLTVHGWVNITSETYANVSLNLNGGIHWIEHMGDWDNWHFITSSNQAIYYPKGNHSITINFSGMQIAGCDHNGPYRIWMGIELPETHERLANCEYDTGPWTPDDFTAPGVEFVDENTSDYVNGTDSLTINASVVVNTPGTYDIGGCIQFLQRHNGWDTWIPVSGIGGTYVLTSNTNLSFNFDQGIIRTAMEAYDYSGSLRVNLNIQERNTRQQIDNLEYDTQSYEPLDFSTAAVVIDSLTPSIVNGDLQVNISYTAAREGTYRINGGLNTMSWYFITGTWREYTFVEGTHWVNAVFDGGQIFNSKQNGPYRVRIGLEDPSTYRWIAEAEAVTSSCQYTDFSAPEVFFIRDAMTTGDVDFINSTYLTINVSINTTVAGTYRLDGGLNYEDGYNWRWITGAGTDITLGVGERVVPLNFNAGDIQTAGKDGPYKVWLGVRNLTTWTDIDHYEYTTQTYLADDFPPPPIHFETMAEGNTSYGYINGNYYTVNITLNVTDLAYEGAFDLHGGVAYRPLGQEWWQYLTGTGKHVDLSYGLNEVTLNFNAGEIQNKLPGEYDDNLSVYLGLNNISSWTEITHIEYITSNYSINDFPPPAITVVATGEYVNDSGDTQYLTVNVTATLDETTGVPGEYEGNGGIHWIDDSSGWDQWKFITGVGGPYQLSSGENLLALNFNTGEIYTALTENDYNGPLAVCVGVQNRTTWENLANDQYQTSGDYSAESFDAPSLMVNCTGDYNNDTEFLTVNVTINATGASLNHYYDIHAGLQWINGWQSEWITGVGTTVDVTKNMTVALNFNGGAIRTAGHNGTYDIWVGISQQGQFQDIAHDQYTTGSYQYDAFAPPAVQIIQGALSDYANESGNLTINVTLDVDQIGNYSVEGGLHWKQGYKWRWITWASTPVTASEEGERMVTLNFNGMDIARAEQDGWSDETLVAWITVRNITTGVEISRVNEYTTGSYLPQDFVASPVTFNHSEYPQEEPSENYLNITTLLNITAEQATSTYRIYADLYDAENNTLITSNSTLINTDGNSVTVSFNGQKINKKHYNGSFEFRARIFDTEHNYECDRLTNTTEIYYYDDFAEGQPEATIVGNYGNTTNDGDMVVNVTIRVNVTDRQFELYADLFDENGMTYITSAKNTTFGDDIGNISALLVFNGSTITDSDIDYPYNVTYLRLSIYDPEGQYWEELEVKLNPYVVKTVEV